MGRKSGVAGDIIAGALAGAAATWVMGLVTDYLYEREDPAVRKQEDDARGGVSAYEKAAEKLANARRQPIWPEDRARQGSAIHWGLGIGAGALYGSLRNEVPMPGMLRGVAYGLAFWLVVDELLNPALRLTPGPRSFPWQAHGRGLAGHLVFGAVAEATLTMIDTVRDGRD
ncbi:MAG: DUF1440 domain-containing protein [Gemmatimonadota bacterium]